MMEITVKHDFSSLERALEKFAAVLGGMLLGVSSAPAATAPVAAPVPPPIAVTQTAPVQQTLPYEAPAMQPEATPPAGTEPKRGRGRPKKTDTAEAPAAPVASPAAVAGQVAGAYTAAMMPAAPVAAPAAPAAHFNANRDALAAELRNKSLDLVKVKGAAIYTTIHAKHGSPVVATAPEDVLRAFLADVVAAINS